MTKQEKVRMLITIAKDDIKDAQMMLEYAEKAKHAGDTELCNYFAGLSKRRITTDLDEAHKKVTAEMGHYTKARFADEEVASKDDYGAMCWHIIYEEYQEWVDKIKRRLEQLNA